MSEQWRIAVGMPHHEVSDQGRVRALRRTILTKRETQREYPGGLLTIGTHIGNRSVYSVVAAHIDGRKKEFRLGRLVLQSFIGPCPEGMECCHGPGGSRDDRLENLRWGTHKENRADMIRDGTHLAVTGTNHPIARLTDEAVRHIRSSNESMAALARQYGVSAQCISNAVRRESWKHVE